LHPEGPKRDDVTAQLNRLCHYKHFRGLKVRRLLTFIVNEWIADGGSKLTLSYIGKSLKDEPLTYEADLKWSYPKTRANLAHVRNRLRRYYETDGYRDPVIIKLNAGSYVPDIGYNPVTTDIPELDPEVARLILRAKTAIDLRTVSAARRALKYYNLIPLSSTNARQIANLMFIPMAAAPILPSVLSAVEGAVETLIAEIKQLGTAPWESLFAEASATACFRHDWQKALDLFELSITASQGEARYFWWYTALLASVGRIEEAIAILDRAVSHFSRTNIAARTDLALLQIITGRFALAEEHLSTSLEFTTPDNPLIACHFAMLYEAQERLNEAVAPLMKLFDVQIRAMENSRDKAQAKEEIDGHVFLNGMFALIMGRAGALEAASQMYDILLSCKAKRPAASSVEIAFAAIGLGKFEEAVEWLAKAAFDDRDALTMWFHLLPPLRHLHGFEPYEDLLEKLHLPNHRRR
jgi:tetratricopeptide (TPR) repeat protein